jgi:hypothetical protein
MAKLGERAIGYALIASFFMLLPIAQVIAQWKFERLLVLNIPV